MKIVIAAVSSDAHLSGVPRHAANMTRCLLTRDEVTEVHLIVAQWQYDSMYATLPQNDPRLHVRAVSIGKNALSRNRWYYSNLPGIATELEADVVHLAYPVPLNGSAFRCPTVVTLHDLYPYDIPANFGFPKVLFNRLILKQCLYVADAIACVSESTLNQLTVHVPNLAREKAVTIYNCVEPGPPMAAHGPFVDWDGTPFFLCIAQHRRNKNILLALQVFRRLLRSGEVDCKSLLVVVGTQGPETARIKRFIRDSDISHHVVLLQGLSDAALQWCYAHCELILAPSIIEGFGLPIVEAMLSHCRVVCSDIPAFREIGGSYCDYASLRPFAVDNFVNAIRAVRGNPEFRYGATARFSSARIASEYLHLYAGLNEQYLKDKHRRPQTYSATI